MRYLLKNGKIVNEGKVEQLDLEIDGPYISRIGFGIPTQEFHQVIDLQGDYLIPGLIDDQVHFREPGLTHKGTIYSESRAALAGGITSYMEMPNTSPPALSNSILDEKYKIASTASWGNYSFYLGASNSNLEELKRMDRNRVCGIKAFMGSSTGNLLVDSQEAIYQLFSLENVLIAAHCEDEDRIRANTEYWKAHKGALPYNIHALLRDREACFKSSSTLVRLARELGTRFHVLHITTAEETELFEAGPLDHKLVTAEACVHHLWFEQADYQSLGNQIKCNPSIKTATDREAIWQAVLDDRIDVVATDHAPHTWAEKQNPYFDAPSGLPLVQHALPIMMEQVENGRLTIERLVEKMCHKPAQLFHIRNRGFIKEGAFADLVRVSHRPFQVTLESLLYKCGHTPFLGHTFQWLPWQVWVNGVLNLDKGQLGGPRSGMRLEFNRE